MTEVPVSVPEELRNTYRLISSAFPAGVPEQSYKALLALLIVDMSQRALARVMAHATGKSYHQVCHDVLGVVSAYGTAKPQPAEVENVRRVLVANGYDEWLAEE